MATMKLSGSTIAEIDELVIRFHKEYGDDYSREKIIDKALIALLEITDEWYK